MELRHSNFKRALEIVKKVITPPQRPARMTQEEERALPVQDRVYRWELGTGGALGVFLNNSGCMCVHKSRERL